METKVIKLQQDAKLDKDDKALREAGEVLRSGGLVAFPTETVYGLGGDGLNPDSARKIYAAKGRPSDNPLIIHISRFEDLAYITDEIPFGARLAADAFWPGPLTMILPKSVHVPYETTGGLDTVAVRLPANEAARKLIAYGGRYVAAPSANVSGKPSPTLAKHVIEDLNGKIDMILDGGQVGIGLESTIIDFTVGEPHILRPGYVTSRMLGQVLGMVDSSAAGELTAAQHPKAPGMKYRHYAPIGQLTIVMGRSGSVEAFINEKCAQHKSLNQKCGVIASRESGSHYVADVVKEAGSLHKPDEIARNLYRILREMDEERVEYIYTEAFGESGIGEAVRNRLQKAAGHQIVQV
jgi:L-threonylcarbamoyladenylate synthase